jgi:hypothetical protein
MINRVFIPLICLTLCYACFAGYREARQITVHYPREYTGIDTLIRIDGYYCGIYKGHFSRPFMLSENGEYTGNLARYASHDQIIADFNEFYPKISKGNYQVVNDTITVNTTAKYGPWAYDIIKYVFVIINDTTLERVYSSNIRADDTIINQDRVLFRFHQYPIENFE